MGKYITADIIGRNIEKKYEKGITLLNVSREFDNDSNSKILAAMVNNEVKELWETIEEDCKIRFLTGKDAEGRRILERAFSFLFVRASCDVFGRDSNIRIEHSLDKGLYCEIDPAQGKLNKETTREIEDRMWELVKLDEPFEKHEFMLEEAKEILKFQYKPLTKMLLNYRDKKIVHMYQYGWLWDYFYGPLPYSAGYLSIFELRYQNPGIILRFPLRDDPTALPAFRHDRMLSEIFKEGEHWHELIRVSYVPELNRTIELRKHKRVIHVSEALHEKKIIEIADTIVKMGKRVILIAGPSSSGKTSFAQRLSIQLNVHGIYTCTLSTDDYFIDREQLIKDEKGEYNFEDIDAVDVNLFNKHLAALLRGEEVHLPKYSFLEGKKFFDEKATSVEENETIIIEGIHGLNEELTREIRVRDKFKIYLSPLTALSLDPHNRIPTTDARLFRRIVRDHHFRGYDARKTIQLWPSVRSGEERNIFPFQEEADVMFNSALTYELAVLKKYCQPLLEEIGGEEDEYAEAQRLLKLLSYFLPIQEENPIPSNSILREFIGGSSIVGE